ncbi:MAG: beta-galactosidase [Kouleothrix sp.]
MPPKQTVSVTRAGIAIDGQPFTLLAGQLHYFRYPQAEWRDLLLKARAGGLNTIDTVIPWNMHEPQPGHFDFTGMADLPGYLDLCAELGLYAIVRPGPYICAEWENGGFPAWLTALEGLELRVDNLVYLHHLGRWFDALLPLLAPRQITNGGPIILCQIENEHWASGRYGHDDHQRTLAREAIARGIDVPQYTCMGAMNEWAEFRNGWSGIAEKLVQTRVAWPENPLIVSELWSGWFDNWGASRHNNRTAAKLDMTLHQLTAVGASGWSHWMWAGGTNFGYWGGRTVGGDTIHMTTSYDYDAPVSEYGGLSEKFFVARRHHLFMSTIGAELSAVLADATPAGPKVIAPAAVAGRGEAGNMPYRNSKAGAGAPAAWANFSATFFQNPGLEGQTYQLYLARPAKHLVIEVEAASIKPIFSNLPLGQAGAANDAAQIGATGSALLLEYHTSRLLGFWQHPAGDTLVFYGSAGEVGELQLHAEEAEFAPDSNVPTNVELQAHSATFTLQYWLSEQPTIVRTRVGQRLLTIVLLTQARAERWWPLADGTFLCGPHLVTQDPAGTIGIDGRGIAPFFRITAGGQIRQIKPQATATPEIAPFALRWQRQAVAEAHSTAGWQPIAQPQPLEVLGCDLGYGWYRATIEVATNQLATVAAPWVNDRAHILVDGAAQGWLGVHPHGARLVLPLALTAGRHELRLLVDNLGRFNYGSNTGERKGLLDTLYWGARQLDISAGWVALWQEAVFAGEALANARAAFVRPDITDVHLGNLPFAGPSIWLLRDIEAQPGQRYIIQLTGDRNPGALYVNGSAIARFSRHHGGGYIKADITHLLRPGANGLAINIQNYAGAAWQASLLEYAAEGALDAAWSFQPGVTPAPEGTAPDAGPVFHRAHFSYDAATHGAGPFKLYLPGMRKGQIWLNGQNVGRYWQIGPQEAYKLPVSWLQAENELLLFDEEGATPENVWIGIDALGAAG